MSRLWDLPARLADRLPTVDDAAVPVAVAVGATLAILFAIYRQRTWKRRWERLSADYLRLHARAERLASRLDRPAIGLYAQVGRARPRAASSLAAAEAAIQATRDAVGSYEGVWDHARAVGRRYARLDETLHSVEADLDRALTVIAGAECDSVDAVHDRLDRAGRTLDRAERRAALRDRLADASDPTGRLDIQGLDHVLATCNVETPPSHRVHDLDTLETLVEATDILCEVSHWEPSVVPEGVIDGYAHAVGGEPLDTDWILDEARRLYRLSRRSSGPWWQTEE
jgi:hypothetical protein